MAFVRSLCLHVFRGCDVFRFLLVLLSARVLCFSSVVISCVCLDCVIYVCTLCVVVLYVVRYFVLSGVRGSFVRYLVIPFVRSFVRSAFMYMLRYLVRSLLFCFVPLCIYIVRACVRSLCAS